MLALAEALALTGQKDTIKLVASDKNCAGLIHAQEASLTTALCDYQGRPKAQSEAELIALIEQSGADIILLAGFMRVLSADFVAHFAGRIINIHPSLLPKYKGLDTHNRALAAGDTHHGVSVHLVTAGLDDGPLIAQASCPIVPTDDEASLAARLLPLEHKLYQSVIRALMSGALTCQNGNAIWHEAPDFDTKTGHLTYPLF